MLLLFLIPEIFTFRTAKVTAFDFPWHYNRGNRVRVDGMVENRKGCYGRGTNTETWQKCAASVGSRSGRIVFDEIDT
jgi:hypothetical protein